VAAVCDEDPAFSAADPEEKPRQQPPWSQQFEAHTLVEGALAGEALVELPMPIAEASICIPAICGWLWQWAVLRRQQARIGAGASAVAKGAKNPHVSTTSNALAVKRNISYRVGLELPKYSDRLIDRLQPNLQINAESPPR
jgi:hypothetical protein